jgi:hypothetical protein
MRETLPDITRLKMLIEGLHSDPSPSKTSALNVIVVRYAALIGDDVSPEDGLYFLLRSINELPSIIEQQFPEGGRKKAAMNVVSTLRSIFSPRLLSQPFETYLVRTDTERVVILSAISLLEDIEFDSEKLLMHGVEIVSEIGRIREKINAAEALSHSSKLVLNAQFELIERAVLRFETSGVGPFRDAVFTSVGKVFIELQGQGGEAKVVSRAILDDLLRLYGLLQMGGDLVRLAAPPVLAALGAPTAVS